MQLPPGFAPLYIMPWYFTTLYGKTQIYGASILACFWQKQVDSLAQFKVI